MNDAAPDPEVTAASWLLRQTSGAPTTNHNTEPAPRNARTGLQSPSGDPPSLKSPEGHSLTLSYELEDEEHVVGEIVAMGSRMEDRPPLTVAFLMCASVQYSATCRRTSDLRRLLLLIARGVQDAMWVSRVTPR